MTRFLMMWALAGPCGAETPVPSTAPPPPSAAPRTPEQLARERFGRVTRTQLLARMPCASKALALAPQVWVDHRDGASIAQAAASAEKDFPGALYEGGPADLVASRIYTTVSIYLANTAKTVAGCVTLEYVIDRDVIVLVYRQPEG
jgi:hypothetical protein